MGFLNLFGSKNQPESEEKPLQSIDVFIEHIRQSQDPLDMIMEAVTRFLSDERHEWMLEDIDKVDALLGLAYNPRRPPPIPGSDTSAVDGPGRDDCLLCCRPAQDDLCKACLQNANSKGPMLLEIPKSRITYREMASRIGGSWDYDSNNPCPRLEKVFKVIPSPLTTAQYETYKASKQARRGSKSRAKALNVGEELLWYEVCHECNLGVKGNGICDAHNCDVCSVFSSSYNYLRDGRYKIQRKGGHLTMLVTTGPSNLVKPTWKVILNRVVVGKSCEIEDPDTISADTFRDYDSVRFPKGDNWMIYSKAAYRVPVEAVLPAYLVTLAEQCT
ncbi:hypothetical protein BS17DRAFT_330360 [Gyrodon lividus]|nr:hypothetical protein BS17DRAFT_330360 [Gyrodon lividus]